MRNTFHEYAMVFPKARAYADFNNCLAGIVSHPTSSCCRILFSHVRTALVNHVCLNEDYLVIITVPVIPGGFAIAVGLGLLVIKIIGGIQPANISVLSRRYGISPLLLLNYIK